MTDQRRNVLVGLFVLVGLACLGILIVMFGESRGVFSQRYVVRGKFDRIAGVREGTDVNLAGVWAGNIMGVELIDPALPGKGVYAIMEIDKKYNVPRGSVAAVATPIMGQAAINIMPPTAPSDPLPKDGTAIISGQLKNPLETVIDPKMIATLEKTTSQVGTLAEALTPAARAIEELFEKRTTEEVDASVGRVDKLVANLSTTVERLHNVLKHVETVIGDPEVQSNLKGALANFNEASDQAKQTVAELKTFGEQASLTANKAGQVVDKLGVTVDTTHQHIDALGRKLLLNADQLTRVLDYLAAAGQDMAEGEGTVALLLRDPKFYDELILTTQRLGAAAVELQVLVKQWQKSGLLGQR